VSNVSPFRRSPAAPRIQSSIVHPKDESWVDADSPDGVDAREATIATFVLIHGAADSAWYWHLVEPELSERGHDVVSMDLPCDDDSAGLVEYADAVVDAIGDRTNLVLVAQSFGGFTAPLVCDRVPVDILVLVAGMIPSPGEAPGDYWTNTDYQPVRVAHTEQPEGVDEEDAETIAIFLHDVPQELAAEALRRVRDQSETPAMQPWPLEAWPDVTTRFLLCRDDRLFPAEYMRRVVRERLGITPDEIDGGHCIALSRPKELVNRLDAYLSGS
jgi:pimeloyl-ACP methyl ester carboxylesterase